MRKKIFTSESVTEGHPDKIADQISDAILDEILRQDPKARVACECAITTGLVFIMGEISTTAYIDIQKVVREKIREIGYDSLEKGFDANTCGVIISIDEQSPDIALGVDSSLDSSSQEILHGAGDQGIMFGFASDETDNYLPLPINLAHRLAERLSFVRKNGILTYLRPDGKTQVSVEYDENNSVSRVDTIVISTQHDEKVNLDKIKEDLYNEVILNIVDEKLLDENTKIFINPTGKFIIGGPQGDCGLTGRKIIVDTYGGYSRHGGGAFSGKDATKVDRSASYMARYVAKNLVAAKIASKLEIQLSYAIGVAHPTSIMVDTFNTSVFSNNVIENCIAELFDLTPDGIIKALDLQKPKFSQTATYGHFGRSDFTWEKLDKIDEIKEFFSKVEE